EAGKLEHRQFFSIGHLKELRGVGESDGGVRVGALTTYTDVRRSELLRRLFPMLGQAARETGGIAIQNRGTVGGNIANASPAADTPPALLVYGAEVELVSSEGTRRVPYAEFHTGYKQTVMRADELIAAVLLPRPREGARHFYRKVGTRRAQAISKVCFAALAEVERDLNQDRARASLASGLTRGRTGGRPFKMTVAKLRRAQAALEEGTIRVSALCARLGISRQALYRYVDADGQLRPQGEKLLRQGRRSGARPSPTKRPALRITRPPEIPM
ncbi:MAG TPA: FAD binding domain-containing protein, partial [Myxococcota bacterium]|nr:FAD binding domain-containing protein [Myxococcota bacterium]